MIIDKSRKSIKEIAKRDAKRFCRRNKVYETYDGSVATMIEKLYITTYLRARHQMKSEEAEKAFEKGFDGLPKMKVMGSESFRFRSDKPNIEETPQHSEEVPKACFVKDPKERGYKHWDELTPLDLAIYRLTGGKLINCYFDEDWKTRGKPYTPVIRKIEDQKERNLNDRITYVVGPEQINVWFFEEENGHSKIKSLTLRTEAVKNYVKEYC